MALRVLYIAGWARSGSTLLGNLLGQVEGCFFAGEVRLFAEPVWKENRLCGCGKPVLECEMWSEIMSKLESRLGERGRLLLESAPGRLRTRSLLRRVLFPGRRKPSPQEREVLPVLEALYHEISARSGASVIIDTSKAPMYAHLVTQIPGIELNVVHLVRDPRATAFSLRRRRYDRSGKRFMTQAGVVKNALMWTMWNLGAGWLRNTSATSANYIRIRYEDMAQSPTMALRTIAHFARLPGRPPHVSSDGRVVLGVNHSALGNPNRMESGPIRIKTDMEWTSALSGRDKATTVLLTWPLLLHYGYRLT